MTSRKFRKRINIYEISNVADGFGGNTVSQTLLGTSWADIRTLDRNTDLTQFGISSTQLAVEITVRKRSDLTYSSHSQYIEYKEEKYTIVSFPTDVNFDGAYIKFVAVKQQNKSNPNV